MSRSLDPDALGRVLREHGGAFIPHLPGRKNHLRAGVLVPLILEGTPRVILTERPRTMKRHAGEVVFPGGIPHESDRDLEETARREAREEIGVRKVELLGRLASTPLYTSDFRLEPFVAVVDPREVEPDEREVARLFELEIDALLGAPSIEGIPFSLDGVEVLSPLFPVPGALVYGGTAQLLYELLSYVALATGRALPPFSRSPRDWRDVLIAPNG